MKCDVIAEGVVAATKEVRLGVGARGPHHHNHHNYHNHHNPPTTPQVGLKIPLIVRLEGTNVAKGKVRAGLGSRLGSGSGLGSGLG